jgi:hypothetical protein
MAVAPALKGEERNAYCCLKPFRFYGFVVSGGLYIVR